MPTVLKIMLANLDQVNLAASKESLRGFDLPAYAGFLYESKLYQIIQDKGEHWRKPQYNEGLSDAHRGQSRNPRCYDYCCEGDTYDVGDEQRFTWHGAPEMSSFSDIENQQRRGIEEYLKSKRVQSWVAEGYVEPSDHYVQESKRFQSNDET